MAEENLTPEDDSIPTKELMRQRRKADYAKAKAKRQEEREAARQAAEDEKQEERSRRQKALWELVKKGADV